MIDVNVQTITQQVVLNCLDYWNVELKERNIDKQYRIDISIYDNNKSVIIGADKALEVNVKLTYYLRKERANKTITLWSVIEKVKTIKNKMPGTKKMERVIDQCFLKFIKECVGIFGIIAEQKITNIQERGDNG